MKQQKLTIVLAAALFLSLSVNFFLAGLMIGDAVTPAAAPGGKESSRSADNRDSRRAEWQKREQQLHAALNDADREIMMAVKQKYDPLFNELRADLDKARAAVAAAMEAEPVDEAILDDAIAAEAAIKSRILQEMTAARIQTLEQLSPEGRKLLREMMPARRGFGRGGEDRPRPPEGRRPPPPHGAENADMPPQGRPVPDAGDAPDVPDMPPEVREELQLPAMPQPEAP